MAHSIRQGEVDDSLPLLFSSPHQTNRYSNFTVLLAMLVCLFAAVPYFLSLLLIITTMMMPVQSSAQQVTNESFLGWCSQTKGDL